MPRPCRRVKLVVYILAAYMRERGAANSLRVRWEKVDGCSTVGFQQSWGFNNPGKKHVLLCLYQSLTSIIIVTHEISRGKAVVCVIIEA